MGKKGPDRRGSKLLVFGLTAALAGGDVALAKVNPEVEQTVSSGIPDKLTNEIRGDMLVGGIKIDAKYRGNPTIQRLIKEYKYKLTKAHKVVDDKQDCDITDEDYGPLYDACAALTAEIRKISKAKLDAEIAEMKASIDTRKKNIAEQAQEIKQKKNEIFEQAQRIKEKRELNNNEDLNTAREIKKGKEANEKNKVLSAYLEALSRRSEKTSRSN